MKTMNYVRKILIATSAFFISVIPATQAADLDTMFSEIGAYGNITGPAVYRAQTANLYAGGSVFMRTPVRDYQLVSMEAPYLRAGCGGIDIHAGGFSFINKDELTAMFKNIGSNAIGYAFALALGTICPDCKNGIQWMNNLAQDMNKLNINSCEAAKGLFPASLKDTINKTRTNEAANWRRASNTSPDQADADEAVNADNAETQTQLAAQDAADPTLAVTDPTGNVVWKALKKMPDLTDDQRMLYMSFVGTVIIQSDASGVVKPVVIPPSKIDLEDVLGTPGQAITIVDGLTCLDNLTDCLQVGPSPLTLANASIRYQVNQVVWDFVNSIQNGVPPQTTSIEFLGSTPVPLYKMIDVALMSGTYLVLVRDAVEITSMEIASSYIDYVADTLDKAFSNQAIDSDAATQKALEGLRENIRHIRNNLAVKKQLAYAAVNNRITLVEQMKGYERDMLGSVPSRLGKAIVASSIK
ncbi:MAG: conjugal transfer protein TraH [Sulfuricaulis sp.]